MFVNISLLQGALW